MRKVLFLPSNLRADAIVYYRCVQPAIFLNANKHANVKVLTKFPNNRGWIDLSAFDWADVIVTQRFYNDNDFLKMLRKGYEMFKGFKVYDTDDLVWDIPYKPIREEYEKTKDFTEKLIQEADVITCTTEYLKQQILKKRQRCRVDVIPNSVDFNMWNWERPQTYDKNKVRILYAAGGTHWKEIKFIKKVLKRVKKKHGDKIETILLSPYFKERKDKIWNYVYDFVPFKDFPEYMTNLAPDIVLAPIVDKTPFMLAKSNIKFLDATMSGAVSILEDCACYDDVKSAIKVSGIENWVESIERLLDKEEREKLLKEAYEEVWQKFGIHNNIIKWKKALTFNEIYE